MPDADRSVAPPPTLRLLGPPELTGPTGRVAFTAERPFQLLTYLACKGGWLRRDELAELLYPGRDIEAARSNLRKVLLLARRVEGVGTIGQRGDLLHWQPDSDLQRFELACDEARLADAVALYGGPLLEGMDLGWPPEAAGWLAGERSRLQGRWHDAARRRLLELRDDPVRTEALAHELLRHDPQDEAALQALMASTPHRADAYKGGPAGAGVAASPTELVGRRQELAQVQAWLTGPEVRLLTLLGHGGIGKTALARAVLQRLRAFFEAGAAWVDLEPVDAADRVPAQAAAALGLAIDPRGDPWAALASAMAPAAPAPRLLVLDNAEALAAGGELGAHVAALLDVVPGLRVLATSRVVLDARGEWRLPLDGLPQPDADESDLEALDANDSVRLFVQRTLPLAPGFALSAEADDVVQLVREVEGLPLALCLLATWRRLMPVRGILAELRSSLEVLEPSTRHERSVSAAFERSWQQLTPLQQRVLGQMALLPQPVDRELLRTVLQAPLPVLASLVDRSLVRADGSGHFALHALIRRLAAPRASDGAALLERHARHMAQRVQRVEEASHTEGLAAMSEEIEHHRAAWRWALQAGDADLLKTLAAPLAIHDFERGPLGHVLPALREARDLLQRRLPHEGPASPAGRALACIHAGMATLQFPLGELDQALRNAQAVVRLVDEGMPDRGHLADALITLFNIHHQRGELTEAAALVPRYQAEALATGDRVRQAFGHTIAGIVASALGRLDEALRSYEAALAVHQELGDTASLPRLLANMGALLRKMQRPADAVRVLEEGLHWARRHAVMAPQPSLLTNLAMAHEDLRDTAAMARAAERAVAAARQTTEPYALMRALLAQGRALAARDHDLPTALQPVWQAFRVAERIRIGWERHECLISAARVAAHCGRRTQALQLLRWVMAQPELPPETHLAGERALREVGHDASSDAGGREAPALAADLQVEVVLGLLGPEPAG